MLIQINPTYNLNSKDSKKDLKNTKDMILMQKFLDLLDSPENEHSENFSKIKFLLMRK